MKEMKKIVCKVMLLMLVLLLALTGCGQKDPASDSGIQEVPVEDSYTFAKQDETKAEPDAGIVIDGVLDEDAYKSNNWLYLHNEDGGNTVDIAMTSHYGEKGMYFVFDVTESVPIYVNLERPTYMNSCIEMYLASPNAKSMQENDVFEIDLLPTGDLLFKRSNGKNGYTNVATTEDIMAYLGATTKGGEVNTPECYGYCMELFIPWDYMQWLKLDVESIKNGFVYINPAHITSYNINGTDTSLDRYWYFYAQQNGAAFSNVQRFFRFDGKGVMGGVPVTLQQGEHYTISGASNVIPGMNAIVNIKPDDGYALTSIMINGKEQIQNVSFNKDGSVTLKVLSTNDGVKVSAKAAAVTEGTKTLSGKVVLNNINKDTFEGLILSYIGPKGEKPVTIDEQGSFELQDMEPGYYVLKAEKEGYASVSRSVFLNQDFYTELLLEYDYFQVTQGTCWVLDEQNNGIVYKKEGAGQILSNTSYYNFTFQANLKYDPDLANLGTADSFTQQRTGMVIRFSNGKYWHIDMLKEKGKYILQYAKISGKDSVTNWKTIHTLNAGQVARYTGEDGIRVSIMRQGNYAAIWLDNELIKVEVLDAKYNPCTAQLGFESWSTNRELLEIPFRIANHSTVNVRTSPFLNHAKSWNISCQYAGVLYKQGVKGVYTTLNSVINSNDVTTIAKDMSPDTNDYSLAYLFKFSNGENFRVRLHHTDSDGVYRIQTMDGSTVTPAWKTGYALTDEQAAKVKAGGIEYRVQILGTTAYVYIDGEEVCTYDLSKVVATGKASGIENATVKVGFALDGNYGYTTEIPFKLVDSTKDVMINVADIANGNVIADKENCKLGDTVTLTIAGDPGYFYTEVLVNGEKIDPNWDGTYSFEAAENIYYVTGEFAPGKFQENKESSWNVLKQNQNLLYMNGHATGNSGWLNAEIHANDISTMVKDATPEAKDFSMIYHFDFSNGETLCLRLNHTDNDGKYRIQVMNGSTLSAEWKNHYTLTAAEEAKVKGDGINFRTLIDGTNAVVYLDGNKVCTIDLSKVISTGNASGVGEATVRIKLRMDGNLDQAMEIPFKLIDTSKQVLVNIGELTNGKITADKTDYQLGDTVILTVAPDAGYSQKLYINGNPLLLDWKSNTYSFVADENVYNITGSFEPSLNAVPRDANRWDTANQAHGIMSAYYPEKADAWLLDIKDEYRSISVNVKNYMAGEDGTGVEGFAVVLGFKLSNNKEYSFRIIKQSGKYYHQRFGINGSDWTKKELDAAAVAAICGDGVDFKLERTAVNTLTLSVNGVVYDIYTMDGVTEEQKVTAAIIGHYGNKGEKVEIPFALKTPTDAPDVQLNIAELTNGTVTPAQKKYQVGDTVTLTIAPDAGYSQKLYINGDPLLLDWKTNTYRFVATEEIYNITGSFEPSVNAVPRDANRWDTANQAHGIMNAYYPEKADAWLLDIKDEYRSISVNVKNYMAGEDGTGVEGFAVVLGFKLSNTKEYSSRIIKQSGKYYHQRFGINGSDWTKKELDAAAVAAICGDGVDFKLERTAADMLTLSVNGVVYDTYKMADVTGEHKVTAAIIGHYGNKGEKVEIPFVLKTPADAPDVQLNIAEMTNGTVIPRQEIYQVGDTVTLTVTPAEGYNLKNLVVKNGDQTVDIGKIQLAGGEYSFVAEAEAYTVEAEFALPIFNVVQGDWDLSNQYNGSITIVNQANGTTVITNASAYNDVSVKVRDYTPSKNADGTLKQGNFAMQVYFIFDNGKQYQVRLHNTDKDGNYKLQNMGEGNSITGWKWQADLTSAQKEKLLGESGVEFSVKLVGSNAELWVDGTKMKTVALGAEYDGKLAQIKLCMNGNTGIQNIEIPFTLADFVPVANATVTIADFANGTVTADKAKYKVGDTVTLTVTPAEGYSQKLYINEQPLLLDWKTSTYSFVATEEIYNITGSFVPSLNFGTSDKWDTANQAHGTLTTRYTSGDSGWFGIDGEFASISVKAKNYLPGDDGNGVDGFAVNLIFKLNNKNYSFRIVKENGKYYCQRSGIAKPEGGSDWTKKELDAAAVAAILSDGVDFKLERTDAYTLTVSVNGVVYDTYTMAGVTAEHKVTKAYIGHYGNLNEYITIPFAVEKQVGNVVIPVSLAITASENGTVTADKESYKAGDIVTLTVTPAEGYHLKSLTVQNEGQPVSVGSIAITGGQYSFEVESGLYTVNAEFAKPIFTITMGEWDLSNQYQGTITILNKTTDGTTVTTTGKQYTEASVTVRDQKPTFNSSGSGDFAMQISFIFANGKQYQVRVHNTDKDGNYKLQTMGGTNNLPDTKWKWQADLTAAQKEKLLGESGVTFTVKIVGTNAELWVDGQLMKTVALGDNYDGSAAQIQLCMNGNKTGTNIVIPFTLK